MTLTQITEKGIKDGEILNADINASAAIAKSKLETFVNNNADNRVITGSGTANTLNGESDVIIDSSGNLGIGAGTPRQKLHISASDSSSANMVFTNSTTGTSAGDGFIVGITGGEDAQLNMQESANLKFSTADTERMRIDSSGKVGIGTTSPAELLHLQSTAGNTKLRLTQSGSTTDALNGAIHFGNSTDGQLCEIRGYTSGSNNSGYLQFRTTNSGSDVTAMTINTAGNVGIGTASPALPLHIAASVPAIRLADTDGNTPYSNISAGGGDLVFEADQGDEEGNTLMLFRVDDSERMRIDSSGRVGINNTSMSSFNDGMDDLVIGNGVNGTSPGMTIYSNSSDIGSISFIDGANTNVVGLIQYRHLESSPYMRVMVENANIAKFTTDGICFGSDTASANALDDYEEGTWSPQIQAATSNPTMSYTSQSGKYTKIGNLVFITVDVRWSGRSGGGGTARLGNFPFTSTSSQPYSGAVVFEKNKITSHADEAIISCEIGSNASFGTFLSTVHDSSDSSSGLVISNFQDASGYLMISLQYFTD